MSEERIEGQAGITDYELAALVDLQPTPTGLRALEAIGIRGLLDEPVALRAGVASLLVRDLADAAGDRITVDDFAAVVGTVLATADDLLVLVISRGGAVEGRTVLLDAPVGGLLLDMTQHGAHVVQPLHVDTDLLTLVRDVIAGMAADDDEVPFDVEISRFPLDADARSTVLTIAGPGEWLRHGAAAPSPDQAWADALVELGRSDAELASQARRAAWPGQDAV